MPPDLTPTQPDDTLTPSAALLDVLLHAEVGEGVKDTIRHCLDQGMSLRQIAAKLHDWTGRPVSYEAVRRWADRWGYTEREAA